MPKWQFYISKRCSASFYSIQKIINTSSNRLTIIFTFTSAFVKEWLRYPEMHAVFAPFQFHYCICDKRVNSDQLGNDIIRPLRQSKVCQCRDCLLVGCFLNRVCRYICRHQLGCFLRYKTRCLLNLVRLRVRELIRTLCY